MRTLDNEQIVREEICTQLDLLASRVCAGAVPFVFRPAASLNEMLAAFRLRGQAVIERGWLSEADLPGGLESDHFDVDATSIVGWQGDIPVASARLIWPDAPGGTPLGDDFGIEAQPPGEVVHLDRICVVRAFADRDGMLTTALIAASWLTIRVRGYSRFSGINSAGVTRLYRRLGFQATPIAPPRIYWAEERTPIVFDPVVGAGALLARANRMLPGAEPALAVLEAS